MSKKSAATGERYTVEEFAVLGKQSIFLLLLFIGNACSNVSLFHKRFEEPSSLGYPREHDVRKRNFLEHTQKINIKKEREKLKM